MSVSPPFKRIKTSSNGHENNGETATSTSFAVASSSTSTLENPASNGHDATMLPVPKAPKGKSAQKLRKRKIKAADPGGLEETMYFEALHLLGKDIVETAVKEDQDYRERFGKLEEIELDVVAISSHGEGLAIPAEKDWIVAVPFCVPGERVLARVYRNDRMHSYGDLVKFVRASEGEDQWRDDSRIQCKYFGTCGGCQYQMLSYERQLSLKRDVVVKAYRNFSKLPEHLIPGILDTLPSPRQYGYRTKLTPHFDAPTNEMKRNGGEGLRIGFQQKGRRTVMDIEECPIGTNAINRELVKARQDVRRNAAKYKRGATILLRDSLPIDVPIVDQIEAGPSESEAHICITEHNAVVRERVADKFFTFTANSFFQNNNGILSSLVECIRDLLPKNEEGDKYLVDAYCGSGLFSICLASRFKEVAGIEISAESIKYAKLNAELNSIKNVSFIAGSAEAIFESLSFPNAQTTILIDPPRKGCDESFLKQLLAFAPARIVYVSCNVHTQARDVGYLINESKEKYKLDSIRGCDLFPQTYHVESLAVLSRLGSESLSKIPRSSSGSITRPKLDARDSILTRTNSLNPVLRINRSASASIATSKETFHAQRSRTNSEVSTGSARSIGSKKNQNHHPQEERSRRTSSESLRHCLERAPSPAPSAASSTTSKKSSPSSFMRRSSSSHSSLNSSPSSLRTPDRAGLHVRNTSTASAPAVTNTVSFPTNYSPTHSTASSTSTAPSFDILKSSLRDTLANYQPNGECISNNDVAHVRKRSETRSVSFMLDEAQAISEAAKAESSQSNTATSTSFSSPSTTISSRTSTSSSTLRTYPVTDWQPISPDNDSSANHMPILPLQLARYIIGLSEKDTSLADTSEVSSERDSTDNPTASPIAANASHNTHEVLYRDSSTIVKVMETFVGLWLALVWLSIGRIVGSDRNR